MSSTIALPLVGTGAKVTVAAIANAAGSPGTPVTLKNTSWSYKPKNRVKEAPNTSDGIVRAPGLYDYSITIKGQLDNQTGNQIEANVTEGSILQIKIYRDASHFWTLQAAIVEEFSEETGADDLDEWEFTASKQSGTIIPPTYT